MTSNFQENYNLQPHNSLAVPSSCRWFLRIGNKRQLSEAVEFARDRDLPIVVLGSGTNVVLAEFIDALVLQIALTGREVIQGDSENVLVEVGAGENWHEFVIWCLKNNSYGVENLALIPGTCGAAPIQNIGAYGVEISEVLESVDIYNTVTNDYETLTADQCELGYRDSIFKHDLKDRVVIVSMRFKLMRNADPNTAYGVLSDYLKSRSLDATPENIFEAVCAIRRSKLPDPEHIPNVGSFFKNPVLDFGEAKILSREYPNMPIYEAGVGKSGSNQQKIPAAWLIDQMGWKGSFEDGVGVHEQQALVIVNPGQKGSAEILKLAEKISESIYSEYGIRLQMEPRVVS